MRIKHNKKIACVNTTSNWPMVVDLFVKWGFPEELLDEAKVNDAILLSIPDMDKVTGELSAWGIPWKREF